MIGHTTGSQTQRQELMVKNTAPTVLDYLLLRQKQVGGDWLRL
jgi:hypothetical protein